MSKPKNVWILRYGTAMSGQHIAGIFSKKNKASHNALVLASNLGWKVGDWKQIDNKYGRPVWKNVKLNTYIAIEQTVVDQDIE